MDRRIQRTKAAVFNAVLELIVQKDAEKITVLELCKAADINKSTFYLHYKSIDECLQKCFEAIMKGVVEIANLIDYETIRTNPKPIIDMLINEVEKNSDYLCRFKDSNICGPSLKLLKEKLVLNIAQHNNLTMENNYYEITNITFAVGGFVDAVIQMLPNLDKEVISNSICSMLITHNDRP